MEVYKRCIVRLIGPLFGEVREGGPPLEKQMEREEQLLESNFEDRQDTSKEDC